MILLDTNVLMYAAGGEHPCRASSARLLELVATGEVEAVIDVEVLQEILHRYRSIGRWTEGRRLYTLARAVVPDVYDVVAATVDRAANLMDTTSALVARDAVHAAVALDLGVSAICSWDRDFDVVPGLRRVTPEQVLAGMS